jgi:cobaltochelatase CobS
MSTAFEALVKEVTEEVSKRTCAFAEEKMKEAVEEFKSRLEDDIIRYIPTKFTIKESKETVHKKTKELLDVLKVGCWAAIVGPTGSGKTLGALKVAELLGIRASIKQMTRVIAPYELIGYNDANGNFIKGAFSEALLSEQDELIVVDELDNANENVIMLLKGVAAGIVHMPCGTIKLKGRKLVVATMNTWGKGASSEYVGRCRQDEALLNEFCFIEWDYDEAFELHLMKQISQKTVEELKAFHRLFVEMRKKAQQNEVQVSISTRNILNVLKLVEYSGWTVKKALKSTVFRDLEDDEIAKIEVKPTNSEKEISENESSKNECPI